MKFSMHSEHSIIQNEEYGVYIDGCALENVISKNLPVLGGTRPCKIDIDIEIFDKGFEIAKEGYPKDTDEDTEGDEDD